MAVVAAAAACFGAALFARDQPCASEGKVVVVVVAAAAAVVVVVRRRPFRAILNFKKTKCRFSRPTPIIVAADRQRSRAIGNDPPLYAHMPLPVLRSHAPGRRPRTPG